MTKTNFIRLRSTLNVMVSDFIDAAHRSSKVLKPVGTLNFVSEASGVRLKSKMKLYKAVLLKLLL